MITPDFLDRNQCILCSSQDLRPILELAKFPFTDTLGSFSKDYPKLDQTLLICGLCGMFQLRRVVSPRFLYASENYSYERVDSPKIQKEGELYKKLVYEFLPDEAIGSTRILEIGGSSDLFINTLEIIFESATIIDPAPTISQSINPKVEIVAGFMEDHWSLFENQGFNLIICRHVIEHVPDPYKFMKEILCRIKIDAFVMFETPNFNSLLAKRRFDAIFHQHLSYFQPETFRHLVEISGGLVVKEVLLENGSNGGVMIYVIKRNPQEIERERVTFQILNQSYIRTLENFYESLEDFKSNMNIISARLDKLNNKFYGLGAGSLVPTLDYHLDGRLSKGYGIIDDDLRKQGKSYKNVDVKIVSPNKLNEIYSETCLITSLENRKVLSARAKVIGFQEVLCLPPLD